MRLIRHWCRCGHDVEKLGGTDKVARFKRPACQRRSASQSFADAHHVDVFLVNDPTPVRALHTLQHL